MDVCRDCGTAILPADAPMLWADDVGPWMRQGRLCFVHAVRHWVRDGAYVAEIATMPHNENAPESEQLGGVGSTRVVALPTEPVSRAVDGTAPAPRQGDVTEKVTMATS